MDPVIVDMLCFPLIVRYHLQEDPKLLLSVPLEEMPSVVALSPDAHTAAVGAGTSIYIYSCRTGDLSASLLKVHGGFNVFNHTFLSLVFLYLQTA